MQKQSAKSPPPEHMPERSNKASTFPRHLCSNKSSNGQPVLLEWAALRPERCWTLGTSGWCLFALPRAQTCKTLVPSSAGRITCPRCDILLVSPIFRSIAAGARGPLVWRSRPDVGYTRPHLGANASETVAAKFGLSWRDLCQILAKFVWFWRDIFQILAKFGRTLRQLDRSLANAGRSWPRFCQIRPLHPRTSKVVPDWSM